MTQPMDPIRYPRHMALTVAPSDKYQYINSPTRLRQSMEALQLHMSKMPYKYLLQPEITKPAHAADGNFGRLHYHGVIIFDTPKDEITYYN